MGRITSEEFMASGGSGGGLFLKLKDEGSTHGVIHPDGGLCLRDRHGMFAYNEVEDGKTDVKRVNFNCAKKGCPICLLKEFMKKVIQDDKGMADEIVLSGGSGSKAIESTVNELTGEGHWQRNMPKIREGVILGWVSIDKFDKEKPVKLLDGTTGLKIDLQNMLKRETKYHGDKGDFQKHPYPIICEHDPDAKDNKDVYTATRASDEMAIIPEHVREVLDTPLSEYKIDVQKYGEPGDPEKMMDALGKAWVSDAVSFDDFAEYVASQGKSSSGGCGRGRRVEPDKKKEESSGGSVNCEQCGATVKAGVKFCGNCGGPMDVGKSDDGTVYCPECKENVKRNRKSRCPECSMLLDGTQAVGDEGPPSISDDDVPF